jgi:dephospho-CoA kinase
MIIGICGKSGSGKSTLSKRIMDSHGNSAYLEIDKVGHRVLFLPEVKNELINSFGNVVNSENNIDRKKLGNLVFNSKDKMKKLTDITWKYMQIEIDDFLNKNKDRLIILDWLLLPSSKYFDMCDIKILLDIPYKIRKERAIKRDNISEEAFDLRENSSIEYNKDDFDYVFNSNEDEIIRKLVKLL